MSNALTTLANKFAKTLGIDDSSSLVDTLKATAFRSETPATDAQMMALLVVANQYGLNPWTKEIYAFPDKKNGIVPVVGVDGWSRIINDHPAFDGMDFRQSDKMVKAPGAKVEAPEWMECVIYRKDRSHPIVVREYLDEVYRPPFEGNGRRGPYKIDGPWQTHTKRFLRHKTLVQAARIGFGYSGIYDQDEAERIIEGTAREIEAEPQIQTPQRSSKAKAATPALENKPDDSQPLPVYDGETGEPIPVSQPQDEQQRPAQQRQTPPASHQDQQQGQKPIGEMLPHIRNKANEKGITEDQILSHFELLTLDGIGRDRGVEIYNWLKAQ